MRKEILIILFALTFVQMKCERYSPYLPSGVETRLKGKVYDEWNESPCSDCKILVGEYVPSKYGFYQSEESFSRYIDSIMTDSNGSYDFTFLTTGKGSSYQLEFKLADSIIYTGSYPKEINDIGETNIIDFYFTRYSTLNLTINLHNLSDLPIWLNLQNDEGLLELVDNNTQYACKVYVLKKFTNNFRFYRPWKNSFTELKIEYEDSIPNWEYEFDLYDSLFISN